jgi:hypothetical protein
VYELLKGEVAELHLVCSTKGEFNEVIELERVGHIDSLCELIVARTSRNWNGVG